MRSGNVLVTNGRARHKGECVGWGYVGVESFVCEGEGAVRGGAGLAWVALAWWQSWWRTEALYMKETCAGGCVSARVELMTNWRS